MEIVGGEPAGVGLGQPTLAQVVEGAQAAGVGKDEVDHLLGHAEVTEDQHREPAGHRLQSGGRGHGDQPPRGSERHRHRTGPAAYGVGRDLLSSHQVHQEIRVGPVLTVRLLLVGQGAHLDHGVARLGEGEHDPLPVGALDRHFGLGGEDEIGAVAGGGVGAGGRLEEGKRGQAELQGGDRAGGQGGELGDLPVAVQHEEVAAGPKPHRGRGRGHADPGQPGDQHRSVRATEVARQVGDDRPGAGQQQDVRPELAYAAAYLSSADHRHRSMGGRADLGEGGHHRVLEHQLLSDPAGRQRRQRRRTPLQVGVGVGNGEDPGHATILAGRGRCSDPPARAGCATSGLAAPPPECARPGTSGPRRKVVREIEWGRQPRGRCWSGGACRPSGVKEHE